MPCPNNHSTCYGTVCTVPASPKRALKGDARERQEIIGGLVNALQKGAKAKQSTSGLLYTFWYLKDALEAVRDCHNVLTAYVPRWEYTVVLHSASGRIVSNGHAIKVLLKRKAL